MPDPHHRSVAPWLMWVMLCACTPLRDLDEAASGNGASYGLAGTGGQSTGGVVEPAGGTGMGGSSASGSGGRPVNYGRDSEGSGGWDVARSTGGETVDSGGAGSGGERLSSPGTSSGGLDSATGGDRQNAGDTGDMGGTPVFGGGAGGTAELPPTGAGEGGAVIAGGHGGSGGIAGRAEDGGAAGALDNGGTAGEAGELAGAAGSAGTGAAAGAAGAVPVGGGSIAPDLPDLPYSPVAGGISYSDGASWNIDGSNIPTFEIHTPTASYWLIKSAAAIVEITDSLGRNWILYNSYRPNRGVPNLGGCCRPGVPASLGLPEMSTVVDESSVTLSHLRLVSKPVEGDTYWLVWDFYLTHVTVTINRAPAPFGFTYHGAPAGNLDSTDQLVLSTGESQPATTGLAEDLSGPVEWAYLTSPSSSANSSLYLIQHMDDSIAESYTVADTNSAKFVFGSGALTSTPIRFSLGVVDSIAHAVVSERVQYVVDSTPH